MHQYIVVGESKDCPKLFETQRSSIGWIKRPKPAVRLNSTISYIKFQTGRSMSNYKSLLSSKQVHHEVFDRAYHVSIYAKCRLTPKNGKMRTLCQLTPFKN